MRKEGLENFQKGQDGKMTKGYKEKEIMELLLTEKKTNKIVVRSRTYFNILI